MTSSDHDLPLHPTCSPPAVDRRLIWQAEEEGGSFWFGPDFFADRDNESKWQTFLRFFGRYGFVPAVGLSVLLSALSAGSRFLQPLQKVSFPSDFGERVTVALPTGFRLGLLFFFLAVCRLMAKWAFRPFFIRHVWFFCKGEMRVFEYFRITGGYRLLWRRCFEDLPAVAKRIENDRQRVGCWTETLWMCEKSGDKLLLADRCPEDVDTLWQAYNAFREGGTAHLEEELARAKQEEAWIRGDEAEYDEPWWKQLFLYFVSDHTAKGEHILWLGFFLAISAWLRAFVWQVPLPTDALRLPHVAAPNLWTALSLLPLVGLLLSGPKRRAAAAFWSVTTLFLPWFEQGRLWLFHALGPFADAPGTASALTALSLRALFALQGVRGRWVRLLPRTVFFLGFACEVVIYLYLLKNRGY